MGVFSTAAELWSRCVALAGTSTNSREDGIRASQSGEQFSSRRPSGSDDDARKRTLLVYGQSVWMAATLALLVSLNLWSLRLYFVVSFIGLLINRLLFAPARKTERWWRVVSALTWLCFAALCYVVYIRVQATMP